MISFGRRQKFFPRRQVGSVDDCAAKEIPKMTKIYIFASQQLFSAARLHALSLHHWRNSCINYCCSLRWMQRRYANQSASAKAKTKRKKGLMGIIIGVHVAFESNAIKCYTLLPAHSYHGNALCPSFLMCSCCLRLLSSICSCCVLFLFQKRLFFDVIAHAVAVKARLQARGAVWFCFVWSEYARKESFGMNRQSNM